MKIVVELTQDEIKLIRERQINQMQMIQAGLEEREPFDFIVQKVLNSFELEILIPDKLETFMYGLMKEARRNSFVDFCENWDIDFDTEYPEIKKWFQKFGISF